MAKLAMKARGLAILALISAGFSALTGCATSHSGVARTRTFAIVPKGPHPYYEPALAGFRAAAARSGDQVVEDSPSRFDVRLQVEVMDKLVARRVDGIALAPLDDAALKPAIDRAVRTGIPVVTFDSPAPSSRALGFVGQDSRAAGRAMAERLVPAIDGSGEVLVLIYGLRASNLSLRLEGFRDRLAELAPEVRVRDVIDTSVGRSTAARHLEESLATGPSPAAIVALTADGAPLAATTVAGRCGSCGIVIGGFDDLPDTLDAIRQGKVSFTLVQRTYRMGWMSLEHLRVATQGLPVPVVTDTGAFVVTRDNVDEYLLNPPAEDG